MIRRICVGIEVTVKEGEPKIQTDTYGALAREIQFYRLVQLLRKCASQERSYHDQSGSDPDHDKFVVRGTVIWGLRGRVAELGGSVHATRSGTRSRDRSATPHNRER
jgi:hypothetical protein